MLSDDDLRRIARRVLLLVGYIQPDDTLGDGYWGHDTEVGKVDEIEGQAAAILREELEKYGDDLSGVDDDPVSHRMRTAYAASGHYQCIGLASDPLTTVVHTTDD